MEPVQQEAKLSVEKVIDIIRTIRNDLVKDFLNDDKLNAYFNDQYSRQLSKIKLEFLKKELRELLISPVDLVHYSLLINYIRESNSASLAQGNHEIFYNELEVIFKKYNY